MATFQVTAPDGSTHEVTAPDGASQADVMAYVQKNYKNSAPVATAKPAAPAAPQSRGLWDTIVDNTPDMVKNWGTAAYKGVASLATGAADAFTGQHDVYDLAAAGGDKTKMAPVVPQGAVSAALEKTGYQPKNKSEKVQNAIVRGVTGGMVAPGGIVKNAVVGGASALGGEAAEEIVPNSPTAKVVGALIGGLAGHGANTVAGIPFKNAKTLAADALKGLTPEELAAARQKMVEAGQGPTPINLNVAQAVDKPSNLDALVDALANSKNGEQTAATLRQQPGQVAAAAQANVKALPGEVSNLPDVANQVQNKAAEVLTDLRNKRTKAAGPYYEQQEANDYSALNENSKLAAAQQGVADALATQQSAAQAGGKLTALANKQAETAYYLDRHSGGKGPAGAPRGVNGEVIAVENRPPVSVPGAEEGAAEAQQIARDAAAKGKGLQSVADALAESAPIQSQAAVRERVSGIVRDIDRKMQLADPDTKAILRDFKEQIAPGGVPSQFPSTLEGVYKTHSAPLTALSTTAERTKSGVLGPYLRQLDNLVQETGPMIKEGRAVHRQFTEDIVTPMKQSVTGELARLKGVPLDTQVGSGQLAAVFNKGTDPNGTSRILKLAKDLRTVDGGAEAFNNAAVTHLSEKIQKAIDGVEAQPNTAANIHKALYGDQMKAQGTKEILVSMAKNKGLPENALYPAFEKVMGFISSAAKRPGKVAGMSAGDIADTAATSHGAQWLTPFSSGRHAMGQLFSGGAYRQIDKMLNTPEGVDSLIKLSKELQSTTGPKTNAAIATFLSGVAQGPGPSGEGDGQGQGKE